MARVVDIEAGLEELVGGGNGAKLAITAIIRVLQVAPGGRDVLGHVVATRLIRGRLYCYELDSSAQHGLTANGWKEFGG